MVLQILELDSRERGTSIEGIQCSVQSTRSEMLMARKIGIRRAEELATALARPTGKTRTQEVTRALHDRLERTRRRNTGRSLAGELDDIARHCASLPVLDDRAAEDILGYDERGLPT